MIFIYNKDANKVDFNGRFIYKNKVIIKNFIKKILKKIRSI